MVRHEPTDASTQDHRVLGRALRELRNRVGCTQAQLSARSDIGASYLSQLENGHRGVSWHTVTRIIEALDVTLGQLAEEYERQRENIPPG